MELISQCLFSLLQRLKKFLFFSLKSEIEKSSLASKSTFCDPNFGVTDCDPNFGVTDCDPNFGVTDCDPNFGTMPPFVGGYKNTTYPGIN